MTSLRKKRDTGMKARACDGARALIERVLIAAALQRATVETRIHARRPSRARARGGVDMGKVKNGGHGDEAQAHARKFRPLIYGRREFLDQNIHKRNIYESSRSQRGQTWRE